MADMILIEHRDGRQYAVLPKDFEAGLDGEYKGFKATRYESGEPYDGPKTAAAVAKAQAAPPSGRTPLEDAEAAGMVHKSTAE